MLTYSAVSYWNAATRSIEASCVSAGSLRPTVMFHYSYRPSLSRSRPYEETIGGAIKFYDAVLIFLEVEVWYV